LRSNLSRAVLGWDHVRRARAASGVVFSLAFLLLASPVWGQSVFPVKIDTARSAVEQNLATAGDNGHLLGAYVVTAEDGSYTVAREEIIARCADDDGCTLRLSGIDIDYEPNPGERSSRPPAGFAVTSLGQGWTVIVGDSSAKSGVNGNAVSEEIIAVASPDFICAFLDDHPGVFLEFELQAYDPTASSGPICSLRVED
jgi:hypothetical protein